MLKIVLAQGYNEVYGLAFSAYEKEKGSVRWYNTIVNRFVKNVFTVYLPCSPCKKHKFKNL